MNHFYPAEYGFLFEEESDFVPGIGEMSFSSNVKR